MSSNPSRLRAACPSWFTFALTLLCLLAASAGGVEPIPSKVQQDGSSTGAAATASVIQLIQPAWITMARAKTSAKAPSGSHIPQDSIWRKRWFRILASVALAAAAMLIVLALFGPRIEYKIENPPDISLESPAFTHMLEGITDAQVQRQNRIEVLTNGEQFYAAELAAIRAAQRSINLEAYIFLPGRVTDEFLAAMIERAQAGVRVNLLVDSIGSFRVGTDHFAGLMDAGGKMAFYHPIKWNTWPRFNNRTHREILVVDGRVAFTGGAGFDDHWLYSQNEKPRWRDTMVKVEGDAVAGLQGAFVENWLEATGEILLGEEYFPLPQAGGNSRVMVIKSSPTTGASSSSRILFQTLLASAKKSIYIATPYFLPDSGARRELIRAVRERGVDVTVITPGQHSDHLLTRRSSRRLYGELLEAGVKIYEYQATMMHAKILMVDGDWSIVGTTNFDNRSFSLNDEINLAVFDTQVNTRLYEDFRNDLQQSQRVTYEDWRKRPFWERFHEWFGWLLERQQ